MPLVRITLRAGLEADTRKAISAGVHRAMVATLGIPQDDLFHIIDERDADNLVFDHSFPGVERRDVVFVQISLTRGRTVEQKKALYRAIADNVAQAGVRPQDVFVVLSEVGREDFSMGDGVAQLLDAELMRKFGWTPPPTS